MKKQTRAERRERFRLRKLKPAVDVLKGQLDQWAAAYSKEVEACYNRDDFPYLEDFQDRTIDVAQPLAAIHEVAYKDDPRLDESRLELLEAIAATRTGEADSILDHRILRELLRLAQTEDPLVGTATELATKCAELTEKTNEYELSQVLRKYGFATKSVRKDGMPKHRYVLPRKELADLLSRYASSAQGEEPESEPAQATTKEPAEIAAV